MPTTVQVGHPMAVKRWSHSLATQTNALAYWSKFTDAGENAIVQRKTELEEDAGDEISFDLSMDLRGRGTVGDNRAKGSEENLTFYTDRVRIDQYRKPVSAGGRMTRKRPLHNLRTVARDRLAEFLAKWSDQMHFAYASGDVGLTAAVANRVYAEADFAGNALTAPDVDHQLFGGTATSRITITASDVMNNTLIERCAVKTSMMTAVNPDVVRMMPVMVGGPKGKFILLMSPWQAYTLRTATGDTSWVRMQQAIATSEGRDNPMVKGGLGEVAGVVLHEHEDVLRWNNGGAGQNLPWARALLLGRQALVCAYGTANRGARMQFNEEMEDYENLVSMAGGMICGVKKTRFNNLDFGVVAVDTYAINPNP
jgi:N4-gp56 family major capsid protein